MSFENVILNYAHPHIAIYLEDNTIYTDNEGNETERPSFNGIQVGFFGGGRDNQVLYCANADEFTTEYFSPNYKRYGQAGYNAYEALATGQCGMYILRLMPDDATYANVTIMVKYKVAKPTAGGDVVDPAAKPKLFIDFEKKSIENATTVDELTTAVAALYSDEVDGEGYKTSPLFTFWQTGRGEYGNGTRIRFVDDTEYNYDDNTYHSYELDIMEYAKTGLTVKERITGGMSDDLLDSSNETNPTLFLEQLVNDPEFGSTKVGMTVHSDVYDAIVDAYNDAAAEYIAAGEATEMTKETLDIIFGMTLTGDENVVLEMAETPGINVTAVDGFALENGTDGSIAAGTPGADEKKKELLIKAFNNEVDTILGSRFSTPAQFCLDAGYDIEVKKAMGVFAAKREYDAMTYLDTCLLQRSTEVINFLKDIYAVSGNNLVKDVGCYQWRDTKFTGKIIPMTITHYIARKLPVHFSIHSYSEPFARDNAMLIGGTDYISGTFAPVIDPDMNDVKAAIYKLNANCYETVTFGKMQRSTGITNCTVNSDRKLEFNEYILQKEVEIAYQILNSKLYKIAEESDRVAYQTHAEKEINYQLGNYLRSVEVTFVMSAKDERRNILRLRLRSVFKTVVTRGIVEIYLDPRTATVTAS